MVLPLGGRPIAIGRLPECDLVLDGAEVSRRHARIVRTPAGPLLVDRSRYGTLVNGAQVAGPILLAEGDLVQVGGHQIRVEAAAAHAAALARAGGSGLGERLTRWRRRYGWAELLGTAAAVAAALVLGGTGRLAMVAFGTSLAEVVAFHLVLLARDLRREPSTRGPLFEFGRAEVADTLVLRPAAYALGLGLIGGVPGILAGKLLADTLFYGPVLRRWHWRPGPRHPDPQDAVRRRPTTGTLPPRTEE